MLEKQPPREALGRGLATIFQMGKETTPPKGLVFFCPIRQISANSGQPRKFFDDSALDELAQSIHERGVLQPIVVRPHPEQADHYEIIAGERRFRAAQKAGLDEVPVIVKSVDTRELLELALIENLQREDLNPVEESRAFQELIDRYHYTQDELAQKLGKSRPLIANALRLLRLPEAVIALLADGSLSSGHARALVALESPSLQIQIANRILDEGLSVRQIEALIKTHKQDKRPDATPSKDKASAELTPQLKWVEDQFRQALGTKVRLSPKPEGAGQLIIDYFSKDDLDRIYGVLAARSSTLNEEEVSYV